MLVWLSADFGATWDERALQKYGEEIWSYYAGDAPRSSIDLSFGYIRYYGAFVELLSVSAQRLAPSLDLWVVRHAVNSMFGWTGVVFAFLLARRMAGERAGWLAAVLLLAMPRYVGESMNNSKDLPFAVLMLAGLYFIVTIRPAYPYMSWAHAAKLACVVALALNVRAMGLVLLGYGAAALGVAIVASGEKSLSRIAASAGRYGLVVGVGLVGGTAFWPWAQEQPLVRPFEAFFAASAFSWGNPSLFGGRDLAASELPWHYLPTWLFLSVPPVVLSGALLSLARLRARHTCRVQAAALWVFVSAPIFAVIVRNLTLYDGIRHVYFIVPPLAILAAVGWDTLFGSVGRSGVGTAAAAAALAIGIVEPLSFQIRNHPNQAAYFSPLAGGPRAAFGRYEMDYWGNCVLQAVRWSAHQAERAQMPIGITANAWEVGVVDAGRFPSLWFRLRHQGGYHLDIRLLKGTRQDILDTAARPDILHQVATRDGTPLCVVLPGPEYGRLEARLAGAVGSR
jgi:hypothetical protein